MQRDVTIDRRAACCSRPEVELRVERLLGPDEGKPIRQILSPGKTPGSKPVDIDPAVQA